jgi:hypothetical protein
METGDLFGLTGSSAVIVWVAIQMFRFVRDLLIAKEQKQVDKREDKPIKLNGTKCDSHYALSAEIVSIKDDVKEVSHKLDKYSEQIFDRLRMVEKDVAVLQARG